MLACALDIFSNLESMHGEDAEDLDAMDFGSELCIQMVRIKTTHEMYKANRKQVTI